MFLFPVPYGIRFIGYLLFSFVRSLKRSEIFFFPSAPCGAPVFGIFQGLFTVQLSRSLRPSDRSAYLYFTCFAKLFPDLLYQYFCFNCSVFLICIFALLFSNFDRISYLSAVVNNFFIFFEQSFQRKRRRRDLNPRAGYPTYTLSRGTSSTS